MNKFKVGDHVVCIYDEIESNRFGIVGTIKAVQSAVEDTPIYTVLTFDNKYHLFFEYKLDFSDSTKFNNNFEKHLSKEHNEN